MNTTLPTVTGRIERPPQSVHLPEPHARQRVGVLDRLALHVGVALIKWSRRANAVDAHSLHEREAVRQQALLERELAANEALQLAFRLR